MPEEIEAKAASAATGRPRVVVSYGHEDARFARLLAQFLQSRGFDAWIDYDRIAAGESFDRLIQEAIKTADALICVLSPASVESDWVRGEAMYASGLAKPVVPVVLDGVEVPVYFTTKNYLTVGRDGAGLEHLPSQLHFVLASARRATWDRAKVPPERNTWAALVGRARQLTQDQLDLERENGKYDPDLFVRRSVIDSAVAQFRSAQRPVLAIVGESGSGKTSVLCNLARELRQTDDLALYYGCVRSFPGPRTDGVLSAAFHDLGLADASPLLLRSIRADGPPGCRFWLLLDALNEHSDPVLLLDVLYSELRRLDTDATAVRVLVTCRRDRWAQIRTRSRIVPMLHQMDGRSEVALGQWHDDELQQAYERYRDRFNLATEWQALSPRLRHMLADPVILRFAAEAFHDGAINEGARLENLMRAYYEAKVVRSSDGSTDGREQRLRALAAVVEAIWSQNGSRVPLAAVGGQDADFVSAYRQLVSANVLAEQTSGRGLLGQTTEVRFVFDRFLEYVLAERVLTDLADRSGSLANPTVVAAYVDRGHATGFSEMRGAVRWALISEALDTGLGERSAIEQLLRADDLRVRAIVVDALVSLGRAEPERTRAWLKRLAPLPFGAAGSAAILAAYVLGMWEVLESGFQSDVGYVRTTAADYSYLFCAREWAKAESWLSNLADRVAKALGRREVARRVRIVREAEGTDRLFEAFLTISALLSSHLVTDWDATRSFVRLWHSFYSGFPLLVRAQAIRTAAKLAGDFAVEGYERGGEVVTMKTLAPLFQRSPDDPLRRRAVAIARAIEPPPLGPVTSNIASEVLSLANIADAALSLLLVAVITPRVRDEPEAALDLLSRMHASLAPMAKYTALRTATSAMLWRREPDPRYVQWLSTAVLDDWADGELRFEVAGEEHGVGHLMWPLFFESLTYMEAPLPFPHAFLARTWTSGRATQVLALTLAIGEAALRAFAVPGARTLPLLQSLDASIAFVEGRAEGGELVRPATVRALARLWLRDPEVVEAFLSDRAALLAGVHEYVSSEDQAKVLNFAGQLGFVAFLIRPETRAGFCRLTEEIYGRTSNAYDGVRELAAFLVHPDTIGALASGASREA